MKRAYCHRDIRRRKQDVKLCHLEAAIAHLGVQGVPPDQPKQVPQLGQNSGLELLGLLGAGHVNCH